MRLSLLSTLVTIGVSIVSTLAFPVNFDDEKKKHSLGDLKRLNIPYVRYVPQGRYLDSPELEAYFARLARYIKVCNCKEPANYTNAVPRAQALGFYQPPIWWCRDENDLIRWGAFDTRHLSGVYIDHTNKELVVSLRSDRTYRDYSTNTYVLSPFRSAIFTRDFWKKVNKNATVAKAYNSRADLSKYYDKERNRAKLHTKRFLLYCIWWVTEETQLFANFLFEDVFLTLMDALAEHPDYSISLTGHGRGGTIASYFSLCLYMIGIDHRLVTFNSYMQFSGALAKHYDNLAETAHMRGLVGLNDQKGLMDLKRGHFRVWNSHDMLNNWPSTLGISWTNNKLQYFDPYKHTGLSIVSNFLKENDGASRYVLESPSVPVWERSDVNDNSTTIFPLHNDDFDVHTNIYGDMLQCFRKRA